MKAQNTIVASILNNTLSLTFSNGKDLHIDYTTLNPEIIRTAVLHGLKQKLVDAAAISASDGKYASVDQKFSAVKEVFDRLTHATNPTWNKVRGNVDAGPKGAREILVRALMAIKGKDAATVEAFLEGKTKEQLSALRNNPAVAQKIAELKAGDSTDGDDLLAELGDDDMPTSDETPVVEVASASAKKPKVARGRSHKASSVESSVE